MRNLFGGSGAKTFELAEVASEPPNRAWHVDRRVSTLDPVYDVSPDERYSSRQGRDARTRGSTLVAVPVLVVWIYRTLVLAERRSGTLSCSSGSSLRGHACHPCDGSGRCFSRRDRQVQSSLLVYMDASRAGRDWDVLPHPLSSRTVGPPAGPAPVVQQPDHGKGPSHGGGVRRGSGSAGRRRAAQTRCSCMRRRSSSYFYRRFVRVQSAIEVG